MQVSALFPTPLVASTLDGSADLCADLKGIILAREASNPGAQHSNSGGWQSGDDLLDWAGRSGATLVAAIREVADHFTAVLRGDALERLRLDWKINAWANINRSGAANALHYHPGAYWSAVFYIDDGGIGGEPAMGGAIEFIDPRGPLPMMHAPSVKMTMAGCGTAGLGERVYPRTGLLVMFPAWLGHRVTPYTGQGTRISIAMNFAA